MTRFRTNILLWLAALLIAAGSARAAALSVMDSTGRKLGVLNAELRGSEKVIPVGPLAEIAGWTLRQSATVCTLETVESVLLLRPGNTFATVDGRIFQQRVAPEFWDGALWIALSSLVDLIGSEARTDAAGSVLILDHVGNVEPPVTAPEDRTVQPWLLQTIILDPGHGGKDPGASGPGSIKEKTITLDIARRLARLIEANGMHPILTRNGDQFVSLQERTRFANRMRGDLFLSIHCNSNRSRAVQGVEAYFLKPARTERAIDAAMRENAVVQLEDDPTGYRDLTEENHILLTMATSQYMRDSEMWAERVVKQGASVIGLSNRGVDQAGFYVLMGASMPAVLVECGYLSNEEDAKILTSERGRQKVAEAMLESILHMKRKLEAGASR